jgi:hypothetical protein
MLVIEAFNRQRSVWGICVEAQEREVIEESVCVQPRKTDFQEDDLVFDGTLGGR